MKKNIGKNRRAFGFCLFFLLTAFFSHAESADAAVASVADAYNARTEALIQKAASLKLAESNQWRLLLLFPQKSAKKSIIRAAEFFLAPDGVSNPQAELEADIRAFRSGEAVDRFPARWKFLKNALSDNEDDFPAQFDSGYAAFKAQIQPTAAMLVYPAGFMQNPASMFGHTFLVFENSKKNRLLAQSVTFSAHNTDPPGLSFALKGLFGLYSGYYLMDSYAKQVLKYSDMDKRDIWEYRLTLSDDALDLLYRHALELNGMYARYLYISRNCTTGSLLLIAAAFPDEPLMQELGTMAEPVEAFKILQAKGVLETPVFRPSIHSQIVAEKNSLPPALAKAVKSYCKGKTTLEALIAASDSLETQAQLLNLTSDYLKYLLSVGKITQQEYQARFMPVLRAMTHYTFGETVVESTDYPHESHDSHKITLTGGVDDGEAFGRISFRLLNHDLIDEEHGLNKNTQLDFFTGAVSFYPTADGAVRKIRVEKLLFADIFSIPACDSYFFTAAMSAVVGMERTALSKEQDALVLRIKFYKGVSTKLGSANQLYLLGGCDFWAHPDFDVYIDPLLGADVGLLTTAGRWKQHLSASVSQALFKNDGTTSTSSWRDAVVTKEMLTGGDRLRLVLSCEERVTLSRNMALSAKYTFSRDYKENAHKAELTLHVNY